MDFAKEVKLVYLLSYSIGFCNKFPCINYSLLEVDKVNMQSLHNFLQKYFNVLLALALLNQLKYEPAGPVQNVDRKLIFKKDNGPEKTESKEGIQMINKGFNVCRLNDSVVRCRSHGIVPIKAVLLLLKS